MLDNTIRKGWTTPDAVREPLYVITPVFNPIRYKTRWKHYLRFEKHMRESGATLYTGEIAFNEREFAVDQAAKHKTLPEDEDTQPLIDTDEFGADCRHDDPRRGQHKYYRFRSKTELWQKERLINTIAQRLPSDWKYLAWIDCDVTFLRPNWVGECIHQLQHYDYLQMFSLAHDLNSDYEIYNTKPSFVSAWQQGDPWPPTTYYGGYDEKPKGFGAWSGLAWACTRKGWDTTGGLIDTAITGAGDWYMAWALTGELEPHIPKGSHPGFTRSLTRWQERWMQSEIRLNVGVMTGSVAHNHHGPKRDRKYVDRANLLSKYQFDPHEDLRLDSQGLWLWQDHMDLRSVHMRDEIRKWFRARNEDDPNI